MYTNKSQNYNYVRPRHFTLVTKNILNLKIILTNLNSGKSEQTHNHDDKTKT